MLRTHKLMLAAVLASLTLAACATDQDPVNGKPVAIRSVKDLESYLQTTPSSALSHLSADARQRFIDSLVFSEDGLASFRYTELKSLPTSEIQRILSLFGVERTTSLITKEHLPNFEPIEGDHEGYWCSGRATCSTSLNSICTSNC